MSKPFAITFVVVLLAAAFLLGNQWRYRTPSEPTVQYDTIVNTDTVWEAYDTVVQIRYRPSPPEVITMYLKDSIFVPVTDSASSPVFSVNRYTETYTDTVGVFTVTSDVDGALLRQQHAYQLNPRPVITKEVVVEKTITLPAPRIMGYIGGAVDPFNQTVYLTGDLAINRLKVSAGYGTNVEGDNAAMVGLSYRLFKR